MDHRDHNRMFVTSEKSVVFSAYIGFLDK